MNRAGSPVLCQLQARVFIITLNRPQRMNAITGEISELLVASINEAAANPDVGAVVLTGAGGSFCAGGDMSAISESAAETSAASDCAKVIAAALPVRLLIDLPKPTIAMVRGAAAGGGLALAAACDLRIASNNALFTFAYTNIGLGGDFGVSYLLARLLGSARAHEFCMLCPRIDAAESLRIGLVNRVVADDQLEAVTYAIASQLAAGPPLALECIKRNLRAAVELPFNEALTIEAENFVRCRSTHDHKEAVKAFIEKRLPEFTGH